MDDNPNAYIIEDNKIIITSGLIKYTPEPEALIGVIAHEIGHIENFHLTKRKMKINQIKILDQVTTLATIGSAIISNSPDLLIKSNLATKSNIQNYYYSYSKDQEREADLYAIEKLNELKISTKGMMNFIKFLDEKSQKKGITKENFMFATHPNYEDRLKTIINLSNEEYNELNKSFSENFYFIKGKLFGYTENEVNILKKYLKGKNLSYGEAIIYSKQGKLLDSLKIINKLIETENNIFLLETKADILYKYGYTKEAKKFYELSIKKNDKNIHVKKRLFNIDYSKLKKHNINSAVEIYNNYNSLIFNGFIDINFYHKWQNISQIINKKDLELYIDSWIHILNNDKKNAVLMLKKVIEISNDSKLILNSNRLIKKINNA